MKDDHKKKLSVNKKAYHNYFIEEKFEAGIVLRGTEVKSLRDSKVNLKDSYARIQNGEVFIYQMHISPCSFAYYGNHEALRVRKLLLHKHEIKRLYGKVNEKGFSLIPLSIYFINGKVKVAIAIAKGKHRYDKRESIKKRDAKRDLDRERKNY